VTASLLPTLDVKDDEGASAYFEQREPKFAGE
jgi:hypothetical protein